MIRSSDEQWERIRDHFPEEHVADGHPGRKPISTRRVLEAVLWILNTGAQWHMLPQSYPNYKTVHRRFQTWCSNEVLRRVLTDVANELRGARHRHHDRDPVQGRPFGEPCPLSGATSAYDNPRAHAERAPALRRVDAGPDAAEAAKIGPSTIALVDTIMKAKPHPEQGFRACLGILRLARSYGSARIEAACRRGNDIGAITYGSIKSILQHGLDRAYANEKPPDALPIQHRNIRGTGYYH